MKKILMISDHTGSGQTAVFVNLAAGLSKRGNKILMVDLGNNQRLTQWLKLIQKRPQNVNINEPDKHILKVLPGVDYLNSCINLDLTEYELEYKYLLMSPVMPEDCGEFLPAAKYTLVCTDLLSDRGIEEMKELEAKLAKSKTSGIDLIIPNRINTGEWRHNERQLTALADYFGYEKIADPIPA